MSSPTWSVGRTRRAGPACTACSLALSRAYKFEGTVVLEARWSEPRDYVRRYAVQVAGYVDYMPPASVPE